MMKIMYEEKDLLDSSVVGNKFSRQYRLALAGFSVPPFFCVVGADLLDGPEVAAFPGPEAGYEALRDWAASARSSVIRGGIAQPLLAEIMNRFDETFGPEALVAVRACGVGRGGRDDEDGASDPFAGLTDSFLYVDRKTLLSRISECAGSVFSAESVIYRAHRRLNPLDVAVAVGVQQMVDGHKSFVAFTRDPRTGEDRAVIAAAYGAGEGLVQEKADTDHFFVADRGGAFNSRITHKTRMVERDPNTPGVVRAAQVPEQLADSPVLTEAEARAIVGICADVARQLDGPQDIEGVITVDGAIHLVQARPVIVAADRPQGEPAEWMNHNVIESFSGPTSALTYSQARVFYKSLFHDFYRRMGVSQDIMRRDAYHLERLIGYLDTRVYYRLNSLRTMHSRLPGWEVVQPFWARSMGIAEGSAPSVSKGITRKEVFSLAACMPGVVVRLATFPRELKAFFTWWDALAFEAPPHAGMSVDELIAMYRRVWEEVRVYWGVSLVGNYFGMLLFAAVSALLERWTPEGAPALPRLLPGGKPNRTVLSLRSTVALAERFGADPALRERVLQAPPDAVVAEVTSGRHGPGAAHALREHLLLYGDRIAGDLKIEETTPRQRPGLVIETLRPFVTSRMTVANLIQAEAAANDDAKLQLREIFPGAFRRLLMGRLVAAWRIFAKAREDVRFCRSQLYGFSREALTRLGEQLAATGRLDCADDFVHLEVEELLGAFDITAVDSDLRPIVARRKAELAAAAARSEFPAHFRAAVPLSFDEIRRGAAPVVLGGHTLNGIPSSTGVTAGEAVVVYNAGISPSECSGKVLIARETDPGWLPLMLAAKGIAVERGSILSHTAITGRMLGIPTVVAVEGLTQLVHDGDLVEIDGAAGTVRVLRPGAPT